MASQPPEDQQDVDFVATGPAYFSTFGVPLLSGREFTEADNATAPKVSVISQSMAKQFFPGRNPIGMKYCFGGGKKVKPDITVIGVVRDINQDHVKTGATFPFVYVPYSQLPSLSGMTFYVSTERDPLLLASTLQTVVRDADANLPVYNVKTMDRVVEEDLFGARMVAVLSGASPVSQRCWQPSGSTECFRFWSSSALARSAFAWPSAPSQATSAC